MSLSVVTGTNTQGSVTPANTVTGTIGTGQVMVAIVQGGTIPTSSVISDNVNTGNYSLLYAFSAQNMAIYWKVTTAGNGGSTIVTMTGNGGYSYLWTMGVIGFVGTPTSDAGIQNTATGTSLTPTIAAASNFNNEIMLVSVGISYTQSISATGWTLGTTGSSSGQNALYAIEATPTTNNFNGSWAASQTWYLQLAGIYDLVVGPPPQPLFYNRKTVLYFIN